MSKGVADLLICVARLKAYLVASIVSIKKESLDTKPLIARKL
jgi:hypothetical protein